MTKSIPSSRGGQEIQAIRKAYEQHASPISIVMAQYHLGHMKRLHKVFDGDLLLPMILGEIGLFNRRGIDVFSVDASEKIEEARAQPTLRQLCNTYSISLSLDLPRETVRRKVAKLIDMGFLKRTGGRYLQVTDKTIREFAPEFDLESFRLFLEANDRIAGIIARCQP